MNIVFANFSPIYYMYICAPWELVFPLTVWKFIGEVEFMHVANCIVRIIYSYILTLVNINHFERMKIFFFILFAAVGQKQMKNGSMQFIFLFEIKDMKFFYIIIIKFWIIFSDFQLFFAILYLNFHKRIIIIDEPYRES